MSDLVSILEKVELAARRASKTPWTDRTLEALAHELAKIIKEHRQLTDNAGEGEV